MKIPEIASVRKFLFYSYIFLLPWQAMWFFREPFLYGEKWHYGVIVVYGLDVILLALILLSVPLLRNVRSKREFVSASFIALICWSFMSILWADDQLLALYFSIKLFLAGGIFFIARSIDVSFSRVVVLFLIGGVLQGVLGLWQFLSQSTFSSTLLGMSEFRSWEPGVSVLKNETGRWLRAYGSFTHPNILAGYLSMVFVLLWLYLSGRRGDLLRGLSGRIRLGMFLFGMLLVGVGIIVTFSRVAWIGAILGCVYLVWYEYRHFQKEIRHTFWMMGGLVIAISVFVGIFSENVFYRFDAQTIHQEASLSERVGQITQAKEVFFLSPMIGSGSGNYTVELQELYGSWEIWRQQPVHNVFLLVFIELGIVGGILFALWILFSVRLIIFRVSKGEVRGRYFAICLIFLPSLLLDHWLWTSHFGLIFLAGTLGIIMNKRMCSAHKMTRIAHEYK